MNVEHVLRDHSNLVGVTSDTVNIGSRDLGGRIKTMEVYVQCSEDPEATATHINVGIYGHMAADDVSENGYVLGTFNELETAFNTGLLTTQAWAWGNPASGTYVGRVRGLRIWPYMSVVVLAAGSSLNTINCWFIW